MKSCTKRFKSIVHVSTLETLGSGLNVRRLTYVTEVCCTVAGPTIKKVIELNMKFSWCRWRMTWSVQVRTLMLMETFSQGREASTAVTEPGHGPAIAELAAAARPSRNLRAHGGGRPGPGEGRSLRSGRAGPGGPRPGCWVPLWAGAVGGAGRGAYILRGGAGRRPPPRAPVRP